MMMLGHDMMFCGKFSVLSKPLLCRLNRLDELENRIPIYLRVCL